MPIPEFSDQYYLPGGIHDCTFDELRNRFANTTPERGRVWTTFIRCLQRMNELGLIPTMLLVNGSFVTGRKSPGDVDFAALVPPVQIQAAYQHAHYDHDRNAIALFCQAGMHGGPAQLIIRDILGAHPLMVDSQSGLDAWAYNFRYILLPPDPQRDPPWVQKPQEKGILRITGGINCA